MKKSDKNFLPDFSHIYVESSAKDYPLTKACLTRFPKAAVVDVQDYKSIFNRPNQDFQIQKKSMKLILAVKKPPFIYKGTGILQDGGFKNFYYNTPILNCLYNCDYCFLQGMYPSANLVVFVNQEEMESAVITELKQRPYPHDPMMLSISYNTDLLAFENILPMTRAWIDFAKQHPELQLEVRTKSALFSAIDEMVPTDQVLLAWTLSPEKVVKANELNTPPLTKRLAAVRSAMEKGWKVRICFDPVMIYSGWESDYKALIDKVISTLEGDQIFDATVGVFRMGQDYFNRIRKSSPESNVYYQQFENADGVVTVTQSERLAVTHFMKESLSGFIPVEKIHFWD